MDASYSVVIISHDFIIGNLTRVIKSLDFAEHPNLNSTTQTLGYWLSTD